MATPSLQNVAPQTGPPERSVIRTPPDPLGRQAGPWIRHATAFPHPGHLKRSLPSRFTTDHGGLSIGTYLISHDGRHVPQDRKASVSSPPTGSSTDGSISTDPAQPQTSPV